MGNELKLSLENFQSISKGELIFHTGTTVIIGQSNSGKSATFRALKACLMNPAGSQRFIKKGTKSSSVALEYNGNQIIWKRTPKESSYIINGEEYLKTGKSNAFKIIEDTGFAVDSNDTIMNIEEELQLPFPFGMSKADLFKLYENVFCISDSAIILKSAKASEDKVKADIVAYENELNKNQNKLKELLDFKENVDLNKLGYYKRFLESKRDRIIVLKDGLPLIKRALKVENFEVEEKDFEDLLVIFLAKVGLKKELIKLKELHSLSKALKKVEKPEVLDLTFYYEKLKLKKTCEVLKDINKLKVKEVSFNNLLSNYESLIKLNKTLKVIEKLKEVPVKEFESKLERCRELKNFSSFLTSLRITIKKKKEKLKEIEEFIKNTEGALKEFKVCPLCHQPINN
jgi:hypothetical protein